VSSRRIIQLDYARPLSRARPAPDPEPSGAEISPWVAWLFVLTFPFLSACGLLAIACRWHRNIPDDTRIATVMSGVLALMSWGVAIGGPVWLVRTCQLMLAASVVAFLLTFVTA
jgi:hypothetical protein